MTSCIIQFLLFTLIPVLRTSERLKSETTVLLPPYFADRATDSVEEILFDYCNLGYQCGTTTHDMQQPGSQGRRIAVDAQGNLHMVWTHSESSDTMFPDLSVFYNVWNTTAGAFVFDKGIRASGEERSGFCTMGLLADGRAVIAFNEKHGEKTVSSIIIDSSRGAGVFTKKVVIDSATVSPQPLYPHIVIGPDNVIHAVAYSINATDQSKSRIYYSRSIDEGTSFSKWRLVADEPASDAVIAVSQDGKEVAIAWVRLVTEVQAPYGQVKYSESLDCGETWGDVVNFTKDRYPVEPILDECFRLHALNGNIDAGYDSNNKLHVIFCEGFVSRPAEDTLIFIPKAWCRIVHWMEDGYVSSIAPRHPMFELGEVGIDSMGFWGVKEYKGQSRGGCWLPQLSFFSHNLLATWCGQWDSLDVSAAEIPDADIYAAFSEDGFTWKPISPYGDNEIGTIWESITNITKTLTPGAEAGLCASEDFFSIAPFFHCSFDYSYRPTDVRFALSCILDHFAGPSSDFGTSWGIITHNPVLYISSSAPGVEEFSPIPYHLSLLFSESPSHSPVSVFLSRKLEMPGELCIYDASGRNVRSMTVPAGTKEFIWDGEDSKGRMAPGGVYFLKVSAGSARGYAKVVLLR